MPDLLLRCLLEGVFLSSSFTTAALDSSDFAPLTDILELLQRQGKEMSVKSLLVYE